jgi:CRISPR type I-E-associated protein CasB/Cse2
VTPTDRTTEDATETSSAPHQIVGRFIGDLSAEASGQSRIGRGDLAALRRMDPDRPNTPAFWRLLAKATNGAMVWRDDEPRWALIAHGMALMVPNHHAAVISVGEALHNIHYAEGRLARLLNARGSQFRALLPRLCRHLAAKQQPLNWFQLADLVRHEGRSEDLADRVRLAIARDYYRTDAKAAAKQRTA